MDADAGPPSFANFNCRLEKKTFTRSPNEGNVVMKRTLAFFGIALAVLAVGCLIAEAQNAITINGGSETVLMKQPAVKVQQAYHKDAKLKTIYSNLGTGTDVYYPNIGLTISGSASDAGEEWTQGCAFTPKSNAVVTEIKVGFGWVTGPNSGTVALYADDNGVPGKVLHTYPAVNNLPTFGDSSSILQTVKYAKGTKVTKSTQYWVVLSSPTTTWDGWNFTYNQIEGNEAYNNGSGWFARQHNLGAFGVFGTN
jgi:hypothetical protein